ncbi:sodium-dependent nutrient amino acid transporter 1-like [Chironomus tepperi]|uniref:sodium-dependent nutrient amino acid transporter 1-like n=1 Tax=Chironomus tepperi TaxID=113505 RepID=UPI00391F5E9A
MFGGVESLNEYYGSSNGQIGKDISFPEIQMSLINDEEASISSEIKKEKPKNTVDEQFIAKDKWSKDIEFLLSCIALSVGLGNVWRFPFIALENGGGAFVFPYIIVLLLVGKPLYYMELLLGQFSSRGCIKVYDMAPAMRGIGVGQVISTCFVTTYYASLMGLTIRYFLASFNDPLPWSQCKDEWNVSCIDSSIKSINFSDDRPKSSAELYFIKDILKETSSIDDGIGYPNWQLVLCLIFAWICIGGILIKGVKSSGKASYFLSIFPYIVMIILLIRSSTLEGAIDGMIYFIKPQWNKIFEAQVWYAAVTQVFYSLAVCFGSIIMYSSYNRFDQNIYKDVNIITLLDTGTSLLSGFIIFGILGHLAHIMEIDDIQKVTKSNIALAFMAYPETIAKIDFIPQFFSMLFFIMLFVLGIGSNIGMTSCVITVIKDKFPNIQYWKLVLTIAIISIIIGTIYTTPGGQFLIFFLDFYGASFVALILAIIELLTVSWIYGVDRLCDDIEFMLKIKTGLYWRLCWKYITPTIMIAIFIYFIATWKSITYQDYEYHPNMHAFGWCISCFCLIQLPIWAIYAVIKQEEKTWSKKIINAFKPNSNWGPNDAVKMQQYREFLIQKSSKPKIKKKTI